MQKLIRLVVVLGLVGIALLAAAASAQGNGNGNPRPRFGATLLGENEVPAILSPGRGGFSARVTSDGSALEYTLSYRGLGVVNAAHIHIGQPGVNGGVSAFLCGGGSAPDCPDNEGEVEGTIIAADVLGPESQGVGVEDFEDLVALLRKRIGYVNVHTDLFPGGEIRGQVRPGGGRGNNGNGNGNGGGPPI